MATISLDEILRNSLKNPFLGTIRLYYKATFKTTSEDSE